MKISRHQEHWLEGCEGAALRRVSCGLTGTSNSSTDSRAIKQSQDQGDGGQDEWGSLESSFAIIAYLALGREIHHHPKKSS